METTVRSTDMTSIIYFYSLLFLGNLVLYNLFVAVIIVAFVRQKVDKYHTERLDRMPFLAIQRRQGARVKKGIFGRLYQFLARVLSFLWVYMPFKKKRRALENEPMQQSPDVARAEGATIYPAIPSKTVKSSDKKAAQQERKRDENASLFAQKVEHKEPKASLIGANIITVWQMTMIHVARC